MRPHTPILVSRSLCTLAQPTDPSWKAVGAVLWWRSDSDPWVAHLSPSLSVTHSLTYSLPGAHCRPVTTAAPCSLLGGRGPRAARAPPAGLPAAGRLNSPHLHPGPDWRDPPTSLILKIKNELMMAEKVPFRFTKGTLCVHSPCCSYKDASQDTPPLETFRSPVLTRPSPTHPGPALL